MKVLKWLLYGAGGIVLLSILRYSISINEPKVSIPTPSMPVPKPAFRKPAPPLPAAGNSPFCRNPH